MSNGTTSSVHTPTSFETVGQGTALRTYDVFDTVVTRLAGSPSAVFLLLGQTLRLQGRWAGSGDQFAAARIAAEARARGHTPDKEVTLALIYRELAFAQGLSNSAANAIADDEMTLERRLLRAVPTSIARIERERRAGCRIAFASDMYLPESIVRSWLDELEVSKSGDRLWVSSESGHSKSDGRLFDLIEREFSQPTGEWLHIGDNLRADVAMPRARGIATSLFVDCHLTALEQNMERSSSATAGLSSLLAGASRWTRLSGADSDDTHRRTMNEYAAEVAGPAVYAFVLWVLRSAQRQGIRKVWFMARDGQAMIPVAREIARRLNLDVDVGYLYGGRQVVKVAALRELDDAALEWMTGGAWFLSVAEMLIRVGIDADDVRETLRGSGLPESEPIGWERMPLLRDFLRHSNVAPKILAAAAARRVDVLDYFRQCGIVGEERCCIVDIGWRGTVVKAIDDLIGRAETVKHLYLYFGLYARPPQCAGLSMSGYLFDADGDKKLGSGLDIPNLSAAMEIFCQANHGSVLELRRKGLGFEPICREEDASAGGDWDVPYFQQRLCTFAQHVCIDLCADPDADLRSLVELGLRTSLCDPTEAQARLMGGIPFVDDQAGSVAHPFARPYGPRDLRQAFRIGGRPLYGMNWWSAGAWKLTAPSMRFAVRAASKAGRFRRRASEFFRSRSI